MCAFFILWLRAFWHDTFRTVTQLRPGHRAATPPRDTDVYGGVPPYLPGGVHVPPYIDTFLTAALRGGELPPGGTPEINTGDFLIEDRQVRQELIM